jgi:hypothetical protein
MKTKTQKRRNRVARVVEGRGSKIPHNVISRTCKETLETLRYRKLCEVIHKHAFCTHKGALLIWIALRGKTSATNSKPNDCKIWCHLV